jgi:hypothetical protein
VLYYTSISAFGLVVFITGEASRECIGFGKDLLIVTGHGTQFASQTDSRDWKEYKLEKF